MNPVEEEEKYQLKARQIRNDYGRCPALREFNGEFYCSREIPCDDYVEDKMILVKEPGCDEIRVYSKCRFVERGGKNVRKG